MKKNISAALALCILTCAIVLFVTSCTQNTLYSEGEGELNVVCTVFAPFEFAREVGGNRITATILQDNGADLHNYTPTTATLEALANADVFIYVGGESDEKWVSDAISASGNSDLISICLMDHVDIIHAELENDWQEHDHEHDHEGHADHDHEHEGHTHAGDEHVWTSIKNVKNIVAAIEKAFCEKDISGADVYKAGAEAYIKKLDDLDQKYADAVAGAKASMVVFADRFPFVYLMHDYLIPYKAAFSGCSTEVNASFETQASLIKAVKSNGLSCVLTIEGNDKALAEAISSETGSKILSLNSMQSVTRSDIEAGADYIEIMTRNLEVLKEALGYGSN